MVNAIVAGNIARSIVPSTAFVQGTGAAFATGYVAPAFAAEDVSSLYAPHPSDATHQYAYGPVTTGNHWDADVIAKAAADATYHGADALTSPQTVFPVVSVHVYAADLWPSRAVFHARDTGKGGDGLVNLIDAARDYCVTIGAKLHIHLNTGTHSPDWWRAESIPGGGAMIRDSTSTYSNVPMSNSQTANTANPCPVWWHPEMYRSSAQNGGTAGLYYELFQRIATLYDADIVINGIVLAGPMTVFPEPMSRDLNGTIGTRSDPCSTTSGSSTIGNVKIAIGDQGRPVTGAGIPANSYVGTVVAGVSYTLSSSRTSTVAVNATATAASVSLVLGAAAPTRTQMLCADGGAFDPVTFAITTYGSWLKGPTSAPSTPELDGTFQPITLTDSTGTHTYPYGLYQNSKGGWAPANDVLAHYYALKAHKAIFTNLRQQYACNPYASLIGTGTNTKYLDNTTGYYDGDLGSGGAAKLSIGQGNYAFDDLGTTIDLMRAARKIDGNVIISNESARDAHFPGGPAGQEWQTSLSTGKLKMFDANSYTTNPAQPGAQNLAYLHLYVAMRQMGAPLFIQTASGSVSPGGDRIGTGTVAWCVSYLGANQVELPSAYQSIWTGVLGTKRSDASNPNTATYSSATTYHAGDYVVGANAIPYKLVLPGGGSFVGSSYTDQVTGVARPITDPSQLLTGAGYTTYWTPFPSGIYPTDGVWRDGSGTTLGPLLAAHTYAIGDHVVSSTNLAHRCKKGYTTSSFVGPDDDPEQDGTHWAAATDCLISWPTYTTASGWFQPVPQLRSYEFSPKGLYTQTAAMQALATSGSGSTPPVINLPVSGASGTGGGGGGGGGGTTAPSALSTYPVAIDVFQAQRRSTDRAGRWFPKVWDAITAIQRSLGTNPAGSVQPDVATRLGTIESNIPVIDTVDLPTTVLASTGTASAGSTGLAADAGHQHTLDVGVILGGTSFGLTGIATTITAAGPTALTVNKHTPVNATSNSVTVSLPTGQPAGSVIGVERIDHVTANSVSITGNLRGVAAQTLTLLAPSGTVDSHESLTFLADSTGSWWPIADHKTKTWLDSTYAGIATTAKSIDVQVFSATGTWTKPAGSPLVTDVLLQAPGGGGGSGARSGTGVVATGGGSGGGGAHSFNRIPSSALGATETVTIGAAGTGGAAVTADSTGGNAGTGGGNAVTFGAHLRATGGGNGGAGAITAVAGSAGSSGKGTFDGGAGQASAAAGGAGTNSSAAGGGASGGGSGGGITTANVASAGGNGVAPNGGGSSLAGIGGTVDTTAPTHADTPTGSGEPGGGGGGGASSTTTAAQAGAVGGLYGGGGGGGGASRNGNASGAGGNGAPGYCIVITSF